MKSLMIGYYIDLIRYFYFSHIVGKLRHFIVFFRAPALALSRGNCWKCDGWHKSRYIVNEC
ncbi:hypothetical protein NVI2019_GHJFPKLH_02749 [Providencia alcalifaciens]|nr:hypothetical protein NVI2019_GHJFPKLH_02749 [Providencia alcalifaciens]